MNDSTKIESETYLSFNDDDIVEVYFGLGYTLNDEQDFLGKAPFYKGAAGLVHDKLDSINFESYYIRRWQSEKDLQVLDFGSHSYFFKLKRIDKNE